MDKVMYTFTSADITALTTAGTTGTINDVNIVIGSQIKVGDVVVFKAATGKRFKILNNTIQLFFRNTSSTIYFTLNSDQTIGTMSVVDADPFTYFRATVEDKPAEVPFYTFTTNDISKATTNHFNIFKNGVAVVNGDKLLVGDVVKVTADTGWKFKTNTAATILTGIYFLGSVDNWFFTPDSDAHNGSFTVPTWNQANTVTFTVDSGAVINDNVTTPLNWGTHPTTGVVGTAVNFTWSGGDISVSPNAYNVVVTDGSTIVDDITTATPAYTLAAQSSPRTLTVTVYDKGGKNDSTASNIVSSIAIAAAPKPTRFTFTANHVTDLTNSHVTMTINGSPVVAGSTIVEGDSLVATANNGYKFYEDPLSSIYFDANWERYNFILSENNTKASYVVIAKNYTSFNVSTKLPTPETKAGNNVYVIDNDKLSQITENRFTITGTNVLLDYGQYILSVLELPFTIDPDLIAGTENVMLGDKDTQVAANKVSVDVLPVNMGDITIPETYNNLLDYDNTTAILHLPFAPSINIDPEYVIGQTLSVEYLIDCYTGKATINIKSTKIGGAVIDQKIVSLGINIPYAQFTGGDVTNSNIEVGGDNRIKVPFIEIVRSDAPLKDGLFSAVIVDEKILNTQTGFITVDNIDLVSKAIKSEKDDLINILQSGVIIK